MDLIQNQEMKEVKRDVEEVENLVELRDNTPSVEDMILEAMANENLEELLVESVDYTEPNEKEILNIETKVELPLKSEKKKENINIKIEKKKEKEKGELSTSTHKDAVSNDMQDDANYKKSKATDKSKRGRRPKQKSEETPEVKLVEEEEEEEVEYEIEKIVGHRLYKDIVVKYEIKWKGYNESDNTLESAKSIHIDVPDVCAAYWDSLVHVPRPSNVPASKANNKRKKVEVEKEVGLKKHKGSLDHVPQYMLERGFNYPKSWPNTKTKWEHDMRDLCGIQLSPIDKSIQLAYIEWNNGEKTIHTLEECHQKCPMKLIYYYEKRIRFV